MPEFTNPFPGVVPRMMTDSELIRAIMLNIAAELEAVHIYTSHMDATTNADAKKVLYDIALEELVHAGEFTTLLYRLDPIAAEKANEGMQEVQALLANQVPAGVEAGEQMAAGEEPGQPEPSPVPQGLTVGSLLDAGER